MKRRNKTWLFFSAGVVVVLGVMAYISGLILDGEQRSERSRRLTEHQARERTALWRLDSALSPLITNETGRAIVSLMDPVAPYGEIPKFFKIFFSHKEGSLSGYGPTGILSPGDREVLSQFDLDGIREKLLKEETWDNPRSQSFTSNIASLNGIAQMAGNFDNNDQNIRAQRRNLTNAMNPVNNAVARSLGIEALTPFSGYWAPDRRGALNLFLARSTGPGGPCQFVWVDWPALKSWLIEQIQLELPGSDLQPLVNPSDQSDSAMLTELPVKLVSTPRTNDKSSEQPVRAILAAGWGALVLALICIAIVLHLSLSLSDRRARFVSTVTHELRTPITTFRMYSQMLADGMISSEEKRATYLETLKEESERISRVLESVLLYSRLEEGRAAARKSLTSAADLLDTILVPMSRQAQLYDLVLNVDFDCSSEVKVNTDIQVVEQIMLNLLDNVAKYASGTSLLVDFEGSATSDFLYLDLADYGPGVPLSDQKKIFKEFHRGHGSHRDGFSGLGLGLALGRDLARGLGGDLVIVNGKGPGARFRLILPLSGL